MKEAIVIGAGAGGAAAARELAGAFHVTLVEQGGPFKPFGYRIETFERMRMAGLFADARMISAVFPHMRVANMGSMPLVWGTGLGGTTNLATGNAIRYDDALRELGICLDTEFDELDAVVPQTTDHEKRWSSVTRETFDAFDAEGLKPTVMPKFAEEGRCVTCGQCVLGCRHGAKWTSDRLLDDVDPSCLTVLQNHRVVRLETVGDRATAVVCRHGRKTVKLAADLVVLAAGGVGTPRILEASGISCEPTFFGDPVLCVAAPWPRANMHRELPMPFASQRDGYILSPYFDYLSFFFDRSWRMPAGDIFSLMIKFADDENGHVGRRHVRKTLTDHDYETAARGVNDCLAILNRLGVREEETFFGMLNAGHPGGTLPLTSAEASTLHSPRLPRNLYVADSTLFPHSMGNPPILTIMALSKKVCKAAIDELA